MTYRDDSTLSDDLLESIAENGLDALPEVFRLLLNAAMLLERQKHLGAGPYERTAERTAHANGFKDKTLHTRMGPSRFPFPRCAKAASIQALWKRDCAPFYRKDLT